MRKLPELAFVLWSLFSVLGCLSVTALAEEKPTIKGTAEIRAFTAGDARVDTLLDLKFGLPLSDAFRFRFRPWFNLDVVGRTARREGFEVRPRGQARLLDGYVEYNDGPWEVRLGQQFIELGAIDKLSPLDLWRPRDFRDLLVDEPVGLLTASVSYAPDERTSLRLLYSPYQAASLFPGPESDWWTGPRLELTRSQPRGSAIGLEVDHRVGDVELGLVAFDHPDPAPLYRLTETGIGEEYVRDRVLGGRASVPISDWMATVEVAQHWPDQPKVPYRVVVGQVEKIWQLTARESLTLDVGYADRTGGPNVDLDFNFPFRQAPFLNLNYVSLDERGLDTTFQLRAIGSGASGYYLNPELARQITPTQRISLGASILFGSRGTFLGDYRANSRLEAKWQIKF